MDTESWLQILHIACMRFLNLNLFCAHWIPVGEEYVWCHFGISSTLHSLVGFFILPGYSNPSFFLQKNSLSSLFNINIKRYCNITEHEDMFFVSTFMNKFSIYKLGIIQLAPYCMWKARGILTISNNNKN